MIERKESKCQKLFQDYMIINLSNTLYTLKMLMEKLDHRKCTAPVKAFIFPTEKLIFVLLSMKTYVMGTH